MEKMLQAMMKRFPLFIAMGVMVVMIALIIGAINAGAAADYYAIDKVTRDTSVELAQLRARIESTIIWLPYLKFLGVAMILAGITMALGVISLRLQDLGKQVMVSVPDKARIPIPPKPATVYLMRMFMMLGMLIIIVGFVVSLNVAGVAATVFSNPITAIDAAPAGSALLTGLASVHAAEAWLEAFKFVGVAFFFLGIVNGLAAIIFALRYQQTAIPQVAQNLTAPAAAPAAPTAQPVTSSARA
ncbi:MAG: hypothetical protein ACE5G8_07325 [Anaerolineae bacterium]